MTAREAIVKGERAWKGARVQVRLARGARKRDPDGRRRGAYVGEAMPNRQQNPRHAPGPRRWTDGPRAALRRGDNAGCRHTRPGRRIRCGLDGAIRWRYSRSSVTIQLNGEAFDTPGPLSVTRLLAALDVDPRRVAVEHNREVVRKAAYDSTVVAAGDEVEVVNFVGGG